MTRNFIPVDFDVFKEARDRLAEAARRPSDIAF